MYTQNERRDSHGSKELDSMSHTRAEPDAAVANSVGTKINRERERDGDDDDAKRTTKKQTKNGKNGE